MGDFLDNVPWQAVAIGFAASMAFLYSQYRQFRK